MSYGSNGQISGAFGGKIILANVSYFVRTDGSDQNDGLANNSGRAFLTIQHAIDIASAILNIYQYQITIYVADGDYNGFECKSSVSKTISINSINEAGARIVSVFTYCIKASDIVGTLYRISGFYLSNNIGTTAYGLLITGSIIEVNHLRMEYFNYGIWTEKVAVLRLLGRIHFNTGSYVQGIKNVDASIIDARGSEFTFNGNPNWISTFISMQNLSLFMKDGACIGAATGKRYTVSVNSVINVNGAGINYFPGTVAGTTATGGEYV